MRIKGNNTFTTLLSLLGVKYTESFSDKYFNEHPNKYNLYGLSKMLSDYNIRVGATKIENKENDLFRITLPFIAHVGGEFVAVKKVSANSALPTGDVSSSASVESSEGAVDFIRNGKEISIPVSQFIQSWSGIVLLAETLPDSIESDYAVHRKKELILTAQQVALALAGIFLFGFAYINASGEHAGSPLHVFGITSLLAVNMIGIYIFIYWY